MLGCEEQDLCSSQCDILASSFTQNRISSNELCVVNGVTHLSNPQAKASEWGILVDRTACVPLVIFLLIDYKGPSVV
jgi:hypothetical protein